MSFDYSFIYRDFRYFCPVILKVVCCRFTVCGKNINIVRKGKVANGVNESSFLQSLLQFLMGTNNVDVSRGLDKGEWTGLFHTISLLVLDQTLWCGCSKESSHWDDSFEYSQHRIIGSNKDLELTKRPLSIALFQKVNTNECQYLN